MVKLWESSGKVGILFLLFIYKITDVAMEIAAFTRNRILAQSAAAMPAQANCLPNILMTLLRQ